MEDETKAVICYSTLMKCKIIDTGKASAEKNMALDYALLRDLESIQQPILHLYEWEAHSATYGHFLDPYKYLNETAVKALGIQLARRPTGGGVLFHRSDFAFSILIPANHPQYSVNTLENYAFVNRMIIEILREFLGEDTPLTLLQEETPAALPHSKNFCMAKPILNDVMFQGKKISGGAQRRTKHGFLHQGTISLGIPDEGILKQLLKDPAILQDMMLNTFAFTDRRPSIDDLKKYFLKKLL